MATAEATDEAQPGGQAVTGTPLVIVGGGEHARVIAEAARSRPEEWSIVGFTDPHDCQEARAMGLQWLGPDDGFLQAARASFYVLGVGHGPPSTVALRRELARKYETSGLSAATVVHVRAWVSESADVGSGTVVFAGAVVNTGARVGDHCIVNSGAIIEHDVQLGHFTHAGPGAVLGGGARVGEDCLLGLGSRVRDHVILGDRVTVGMGGVVVRDVDCDSLMLGIPARNSR